MMAAAASPRSDTQSASRKLQPRVRLSRRQNHAATNPTRNGIRKKLGHITKVETSRSRYAPTNNVTAKSTAPPTAFAIVIPSTSCQIGRLGGNGGGESIAGNPLHFRRATQAPDWPSLGTW